MIELSGNDWNGYLDSQCDIQGAGVVDGYPWCFRAKGESWSFEIAEDQELDREQLPLVGYGASGWLVEDDFGKESSSGCMKEQAAVAVIQRAINLFRMNKLTYMPLVTSNC